MAPRTLMVALAIALTATGCAAVKHVSRGPSPAPKGHWDHWVHKVPTEQHRIEGMRVPRKYFMVEGFGETDQGSGSDPFETGAHDLAMEADTSILPPEAEEISFEEAQPYFHHGAVLECILAEQHGARGERVTAGVGRMMVMDRRDGKGSRPMGGFAVEYEGGGAESYAKDQLDNALDGLFDRRFSNNDHSKREKVFTVSSSEVTKAYGTAMAGMCFVDYIIPVYTADLRPAQHGSHGAEL